MPTGCLCKHSLSVPAFSPSSASCSGPRETHLYFSCVSWELRDPNSGNVDFSVGKSQSLWASDFLPLKQRVREFPGGPVVKRLYFHCRRHGLNIRLGN